MLLLATDSEQVFVDQRQHVALQVDLLLYLGHSLVDLQHVNRHAKYALL